MNVPRSFLERFRRRKLAHWGAAYLAAAWLALQLLDLLHDAFHWPDAVQQGAIGVLAVGFLAALVLAWYHGEKGAQRVSGPELVMIAGILVVAGGVLALVIRGAGPAPQAAGGSVGSPGARTPGKESVLEQGSIAVLPFVNMSADSAQEYFSDGVTEELLNVLAQLPQLRVISRTSSFAFKGSRAPLDSIARALHVAHVLEGSVRTAGNRVRITAQLIDARSGYHLWSESYDRELRDIFAVQGEIARAIVGALEVKLGGDVAATPLVVEETRVPEAHALLLQALQLLRPYTREGTARAAGLLQQAIARDPGYARAYAELGRVSSYQAYAHWGPREELFETARGLARRSLAIGPDLPETEYVLGFIAEFRDWDFDSAEAHYRGALSLNPGYARVRSLLGLLLLELARRDEGIAEARRAVELDPLDPGVSGNLGIIYGYLGQFDRAREALDAALALSPDDPLTLGNAAVNLVSLGRMAEAIATVERARTLAPGDPLALGYTAYIYAWAGRRADALREIRTVEKMPGDNDWVLATAYAALGDGDRVFALLDHAVRARDPFVLDIGIDPMLAPIRDDPRMRQLLDRIGLP
ncbi:MAG: tetratricopeptide repeat protein [Gemmatimonadetes bacterium]|nr:tetratricopeptide repeat protein [Gemmatimonadota bacterium]